MTTEKSSPSTGAETGAAAPWMQDAGVVKFLEFPVRRAGMSRRDFHLYWSRHHSPHVMNVTHFAQFMRKYITAHVYPEPLQHVPTHYLQPAHLEGASEVWINSLDEVGAWFSHPSYAELIQPDEARFLAQDGRGMLVIAKEEPLYVPDIDLTETGLTKVLLLTRRKTGAGHAACHAAASEHARGILTQPTLRQHLKKLVVSHKLVDPLPAGIALSDIDVVLELWFAGRDKVAAFFSEPAYGVVRESESDVFDRDSIQLLCAKVQVIHDEFSFQPSTTQPQSFSWLG